MTPKSLLIVSLLVVSPVGTLYAQDEQNGDKPAPTVRMPDGSRERVGPAVGGAVARPAPQPAPAPAPAPAPQPAAPRVDRPVAAAPAAPAAAPADDQRARERDGGRDRADNPAVGRAVPRGSRQAPAPPPPSGRNDGRAVARTRGGNVYVTPPVYNYYYYPRRYYPYGYGAFGLGYFYYDPYTWYPPSYNSGYYGGYYGGGYSGGGYFEGELRIDVSPRFAEVYVDGYFAGRVDDFDGVFQALKLEEGAHHIQIVAPGFAPLDFDVRIEWGRKITYRGALAPYRP